MGALISGLLDLLRWLAQTFANVAEWLVATIRAVAEWVIRLVEYPLVWLWNAGVEVITWLLNAVFWLLGHLVDGGLAVLEVVVKLAPPMPQSLTTALDVYIVPAYNVANQILPIQEAMVVLTLWGTFYSVMAVWRLVTFIRGGR